MFNSKSKNKAETSTKDEKQQVLINSLAKKWNDAKTAKDAIVSDWDDYLDAYKNDYFINEDAPSYKSNLVVNYIFSTIETIKPIMLDNNPKIVALPKTPQGMQSLNAIESLMNYEWNREDMDIKLYQAVTTSLQLGTAIFGVYWNGKEENGLGNVDVKIINPYNIFPDPMATCLEDAEYVIYAKYMNTNMLKAKFSKKAKEIEAHGINHEELLSSGQDNGSLGDTSTLVLEMYLKDYTVLEEEYTDPEDETQLLKKTVKKYPNGRVITFCPDLNLILDDKKNPYTDGEFPLVMLKAYDDPFHFWGTGEIERLISPQKEINELMNQVIDNAKLTANMPWILDKNCGIGQGKIDNRPGLIIRKTPGTRIERPQPPQMPIYVENAIETLKRDMEVISGVFEITQGRKPGSVTAANAIMALQEAAQGRIRLKVKLLEFALRRLGTKWYNTIRQFWKTERYIGAIDDEELVNFIEIDPEMLKLEVDFMIRGGSTMPTNKPAMLDQMIRLGQTIAEDGLPVVDRSTILTYANVPNKNKILENFSGHKETQKAEEQEGRATGMAEQQMMAEQQAILEQQKTENHQITDDQIGEVIQVIMSDPALKEQLLMMLQGGGQKQGQSQPMQQMQKPPMI